MQVMKRLALLVCAIAMFAVPATANATITTKTIQYGPYTIPAGSGDPMDHMGMGMLENQIVQNIAKPCTSCTIIGVTPDLVYSNGSEANIATGPMLHHAVFLDQAKSDVTCGSSGPGLLGQRFFASGNERTAVDLSSLPYGYKVGKSDTWNMIYDLANWETTTKTVYIKITWKYATGTDAESRSALTPVWLDQAGCSMDSLITVPMGESDTHMEWKATFSGKLIAAAGHIHDYGVREELTNKSKSEALLCNSIAGYGGTGYVTPDGMEHISSMSVCTGNPIATVNKGEILRLHTIYNNMMEMPAEDVMGIMIAYFG
jgi:hypothetical protein